MHLKSIEMVGFKSFADKTLIELKPGISGVVGPNGCGKSNVVDALRWCLGEMSARSLRSKQMLDVIFAGAAGRAPMNLAEVTLTFDNAHKLLPIEYTEIQVTRRLFRSGESEYFMNRTQCRLKDIKDLFMDTGLHEGYSILAQGEVDFVMNAKPEERRELFEEAAGISKYKARREEALRKLEKLETDLNRLNDIMGIVKEQMDALEAAARKAKLFQKVKEELKQLEITDSLHKMIQLDEQIKTYEKKMEELRAEYEKATTALDQAEVQLTQYHMEQDAAEKELYERNIAILELDKLLNASDNAIRTEKEREQDFTAQIRSHEEKIQSLQGEKTELEKRCAQSRSEIETAEKTLHELQFCDEEAKFLFSALQKDQKNLESEKIKISEVIFDLNNKLSASNNEKNSLSALKIHKESEAASHARDIEKTRQENIKISQELEAMKLAHVEALQLKGTSELEHQAAQNDLIATHEKDESLRIQIQSLRIAIAHADAQRKILQKKFDKDPYHKGTQQILSQNFAGLRGVVGILFKYQAHMSHWMESVLGSRMNMIVFERMDQAQEALAWLAQHDLGRARCIILEKIPETALPDLSSISNANSLTSFVQCDPAFENLKRYLLGQAFLSGGTLYDASVVDGGSELAPPEPKEDSVQSFQNEFLTLKNLEDEIAANQELLRAMEQESFAAETRLAHLKSVLEEKEREMNRKTVETAHSEEIIGRKAEELDLSTRELALFENSQTEVKGELDKISSDLAAWDLKLETINSELIQKEEERTTILNALEKKRMEAHEKEVNAKECEIRLETFNQDFEKRQAALADWEMRYARSLKEEESSKTGIETLKQKIEESRMRQQTETEVILKSQEEKTNISSQVEALLSAKKEREDKNRDFLQDLQKTRERQGELTMALHQADLDFRGFESEKKNILSRMAETYAVTLEQIEKDFKPEPVSAEEILKLKKRVETMSLSINLEAPEQHQALSERYNFLSTQTQDLGQARADLKTAIQQINATTREQFKETFVKVRENFQKLYGTLFAGGVADLVFTDEQNLLETGIDIVAQPPGKKLQNIALLSGGEKALTAISLLFAFFMVKPSPFCVLDEVDAPWDAANVARFLNLLKEFSEKIQFLVVTHNPRTMEMADILYGVTMQEFGISKILSTRLKKESAIPPKQEEAQELINSN